MKEKRRIRRTKVRSALADWPTLVSEVMSLNERELEEALRLERLRERPRPQFVRRIHQRLSKVRSQRERGRLMKEVDREDAR